MEPVTVNQGPNPSDVSVVVLAGGVSPEREVSLRSGRACYESLLKMGYRADLLDIRGPEACSSLLAKSYDIAFLTTHGEGGEDGKIQGFLDWIGLPYTGSSAQTSALCMDKYLTQSLLQKKGLPCAPCMSPSGEDSFALTCETLGATKLFAKPRRGGSSIGAGKLHSEVDWNSLVSLDGSMIVETQLTGREITVGLLQTEGRWQVLPILELVAHNEFYDYEAKYTAGMTDFLCPAPLEESLCQNIGQLALAVASEVQLYGYGRVDMMLTETGPMILEVNTVPGMTATSDLPAMAAQAGLDFDALVKILLDSAQRPPALKVQ